jgi:hypothetical protein
MTAITLERIDELVVKLSVQGNENGTINCKLAALSKMLTFAFEHDKISKLPKITKLDEAEHRDLLHHRGVRGANLLCLAPMGSRRRQMSLR